MRTTFSRLDISTIVHRRRAAALLLAALAFLLPATAFAQQAASAASPDISLKPSLAGKSAAEKPAAKPGWIEGILRTELKQGSFAWGSETYIRVFKEENILEVWMKKGDRFEKFKDFRICKWSGKVGPKLHEGDKQSPEGIYTLTRQSLLPRTKNHRAIALDFPNAYDRHWNRTGSYLQIHGGCGSIGCFAMTDRGIEEIYRLLDASFDHGQTRIAVHVFPFRMSAPHLLTRKKHHAYPFWSMLQPIYQRFNTSQSVPDVRVCDGRYAMAGNARSREKKCVPVWDGSRVVAIAKRETEVREQPAHPPITVKCNLKLPSCKKWLANKKRVLARKGIRTSGIRLAGPAYVRRARAGSTASATRGVVYNAARERRRRRLRQ